MVLAADSAIGWTAPVSVSTHAAFLFRLTSSAWVTARRRPSQVNGNVLPLELVIVPLHWVSEQSAAGSVHVMGSSRSLSGFV